MTNRRIELGKKGEALVIAHLQKLGFAIVCTNYAKRGGEIDIIATKPELIAFVEVKLRRSPFITLAEMIPPSKRLKIVTTAKLFLSEHPHTEHVIRFDAALVESIGNDYTVTYYENAFTP